MTRPMRGGSKRIIDAYFGVVSNAKEVQLAWESLAAEHTVVPHAPSLNDLKSVVAAP